MTSDTTRQEFLDRLQRHFDDVQAPLIDSAHHLEDKLLRAPFRDATGWRREVAMEADDLRVRIETHISRAESYSGLVREMEVLQGHPRELTRLHDSHQQLLAASLSVLSLLDAQPVDKSPAAMLRGIAALAMATREHQAREVDVIYEIFWRDAVGGD